MEIPEAPKGDIHVNGDPLENNSDQKTTNTPAEENHGDVSSFSDPKAEENKITGEEETIGGMRRQLGELGGAVQRALLSENPKEAILSFIKNDKNIRKSFEKSFGSLEEFEKSQNQGSAPKEGESDPKAAENAVGQSAENTELALVISQKASSLNLNRTQADAMKAFAEKVTSGDSSIPLETAMETWRILHLGAPQTSKTVPVPTTHTPEPKGNDDALSADDFAKKHGLRRSF